MSVKKLNDRLEKEMETLMSGPNVPKVMEPGFADKRLYAIYLIETYHYTLHNARNQALVATRKEGLNINYMKFCLKHAYEEAGHEMMAFHDLVHLGYNLKVTDLPRPLDSTSSLIAFLYYAAETFEPVARLGYSYWAERSYEFIQPLLELISGGLGVPKKAMTFFNEHSEIDAQHAIDVENAIERFVKEDKEWQQVEEVMVNSLKLTGKMLDDVLDEFIKLKEGTSERYAFLK